MVPGRLHPRAFLRNVQGFWSNDTNNLSIPAADAVWAARSKPLDLNVRYLVAAAKVKAVEVQKGSR